MSEPSLTQALRERDLLGAEVASVRRELRILGHQAREALAAAKLFEAEVRRYRLIVLELLAAWGREDEAALEALERARALVLGEDA
jgi:hypothetical protein